MTLSELDNYFRTKNIHPDAISLGVGLPSETEKYCIVKINNTWEVYYSERGTKGQLTLFKSETKACDYFINLVLSDNSVWLP